MMKQLKCILVLGALLVAAVGSAAVLPQKLRCEYRVDPLGIDVIQPRLSWIVTSAERGERQTAYQILVASSPQLLRKDQGDLWDSGQVTSDENTQVVYAGKPLESREGCFWKVRIWDAAGKCQGWSPVAGWTMGLLQPGDWSAQWISATAVAAAKSPLVIQHASYEAVDGSGAVDVTATLAARVQDNHLIVEVNNKSLGADPVPNVHKRLVVDYLSDGQRHHQVVKETETLALPEGINALRYLRKPFALKSSVKHAVLYASALGLYEVHLNGQRVGDHILAPDWTDYRKRVQYQTYDVTALVKSGDNAMAALLANGWYSGHIGNGGFQFFGRTPAFLAQLEVTYADGATERIVTDPSWRAQASPVLSSDFMMGEDYDARRELPGWDQPGLDESR
ncbi:MAG TPA: alpha-L-rhamnosidase N-terminal domain-containing protein, partial [Dongiaceae bacterium]|nr:alpha-L-rhamnosidase N-terminal domain-containing protein [Dongiaceae bacterium]